MSVSLSEVLAGAEAQAVPLSAECAGYLVLAAADQAALSPRRVQACDVCLLDDGAVRLLGRVPADDATAEGDLRELLGGLLSSASSTTAGLMRARRRAAGAGVGALLRELERALIPVNRSAARRALARLARETERAKDEGRLAAPPQTPAAAAPESAAAAPSVVAMAPVPAAPVFAESAPAPAAPELAESAAPPAAPNAEDPGFTQALPRVEVTERLVLPSAAAAFVAAPVVVAVDVPAPAPRRPSTDEHETETRPEPVVLRASQRPPATPEALDALPAPVNELPVRIDTPVFGTVLAPFLVAEAPRLSVAELAEALATPVPPDGDPDGDELELDIEVAFSSDETTVVPDDVELMLTAEEGTELERTEPCASPPAETLLPPPLVAVTEVELPDDVLASAPDASNVVEAAETGTVLPPWVAARPEPDELSPLPHVVVPGPRESNVSDLLDRMTSAASDVDEVRSGLKRIAGLDPTPPPPGSVIEE
jgi:hypothetical protein